ncbi:MAG: NTP transferase domain-containing protein [Armatimonadia bacterium]|nr:NTP transferase domain-containing protein [Armatimonadia bacterium]
MLGAVLIVQGAGVIEPESVERALTALESVCDRVIVLGGPERAGPGGRELPSDADELTAVNAALHESRDGHCVVLAGDLRHPSVELLRYMLHIRGSFEVVVPERRDGSPQPLCALYHTALVRRAEGLLAAGERTLAPLLDLATVRRVSVEEVAKFGDPQDLLERSGSRPL